MHLHSSIRGAVAATLLVCPLASAQTTEQLPGFELERLETNVGRGTLLVGNGELMVPGGLSISLIGHYQRLPLRLNDGEQDLDVVRDRATALLAASYGVQPWLELSAQVPFVLWQHGDDPTLAGLSELAIQGVGTPVLQARLGLLSQRKGYPVNLSADLGAGLPLGTKQALAGDAGPRFHARMVVGTTVGWLQPSLEAGVLFRPPILMEAVGLEDKRATSAEVRLGAALSTTGTGLRGELGTRATLSPQLSMDVLGGVRFPLLIGLDAFVLGGPSFGTALGTPRFRVLAGVAFRSEPPPRITDLDPIKDATLQLDLDKSSPPQREDRIRPVGTWELNALSRGDPQETSNEDPREPLRPYQPSPRERIVLRGEIHFAQGSWELPNEVALLDQVVLRFSEQTRKSTIIIEGHADRESTDMSNMTMSLHRAQAVWRYLKNQGIHWTQVQIRGFSSDWPVSPRPATEQERQLNRRVEVLVVTETAAPITTQAPAP
ncbi:OmpA family protein [Archangium lipolyticum]|uniref:OmpA family protein n=1 Tax=Archangium lipolyticum TaxID=2970465 RepID=UPI002149F525|nr:OmpA family protein [Archangium lipolyticum]